MRSRVSRIGASLGDMTHPDPAAWEWGCSCVGQNSPTKPSPKSPPIAGQKRHGGVRSRTPVLAGCAAWLGGQGECGAGAICAVLGGLWGGRRGKSFPGLADFMVVATEFIEEVDVEFDVWLASQAGAELPLVEPLAAKVEPVSRRCGRSSESQSPTRTESEPEPDLPPVEPSPLASFASFGQETAPGRVVARSDSGRRLDAHLLTVVAVAGALPRSGFQFRVAYGVRDGGDRAHRCGDCPWRSDDEGQR